MAGLRLLWSVPTVSGEVPAGGEPNPVVADGLVYVAPSDGVVRALDAFTGAPVWTVDTGAPISYLTAPTVAGRAVFVANDDGVVFSLNAATGTTNWSEDVGDFAYGTITVWHGLVYVHASDGFLFALDVLTGVVTWSTGSIGNEFSLNEGVIVGEWWFCDIEGIDAATGASLWSLSSCELGEWGIPSAKDGVAFVPQNSEVLAVDQATGKTLWSVNPGGFSVGGAPAIAGRVIYTASDSVLSAHAGTRTVWSRAFAAGLAASPAVANGVLYLGSSTGRLVAFDLASGDILWASRRLGSALTGSPAVAHGIVYASDENGTLYAFGLP